jgi:cation-transporting ATPase 13A3/4/5
MTVIEFLITVKTRVDMVENEGVPASDVILSVFDLITVAIPPALPTCMQIGVSIGISRLKSKHIFCISP